MDIILGDRKTKILDSIIDSYIKTAEPLGSRNLSKKYDLGISAATIRNEMSDLEELGYLEKSHISSGRIPTSKAFRLYADRIIHEIYSELNNKTGSSIAKISSDRYIDTEQLIKNSSKLISELINCLAVSLVIKPMNIELSYTEILQINKTDYVMVNVFNSGEVNNVYLKLSNEISSDDLRKVNFHISSTLNGKKVGELNDYRKSLSSKLNKYAELSYLVDDVIRNEIERFSRVKVGCEGISNIFKYSEFLDVDTIRKYIEFTENDNNLANLLLRDNKEYIQVYIGEENEDKLLKNNTVVIATCFFKNNIIGKIGIIGPIRMEYKDTIGAMLTLMWGINNSLL